MIRFVEIIVGLALIYFALDQFGRARQSRGFLYGLVAIAGLILVVHGILIYLVPNFFKPSFY